MQACVREHKAVNRRCRYCVSVREPHAHFLCFSSPPLQPGPSLVCRLSIPLFFYDALVYHVRWCACSD